MMNTYHISILKDNSISIPVIANTGDSTNIVLTLSAELNRLGYMLSKPVVDILVKYPRAEAEWICLKVLKACKELKGDDVKYTPMYPNFPQQVMEMSDLELYMNAILHYWTYGRWLPQYVEEARDFAFEDVEYTVLHRSSENIFEVIGAKLLSTNDSLSDLDKEILMFLITHGHIDLANGYDIPYKETLCMVADYILERKPDIAIGNILKTTTDILRYCVHKSGGDISLAEKPKFKSFKRAERRNLINALEGCINKDDIKRHKDAWVKLFHSLHVGEYSKKCPQVAAIAWEFRNQNNVATSATAITRSIDERKLNNTINLLKRKPGEFARKVMELLNKFTTAYQRKRIVNAFDSVIDSVSTRVLVQLAGALKTRYKDNDLRVVFPKGSLAKAIAVRTPVPALDNATITHLFTVLAAALTKRNEDAGKKVFIGEDMEYCPLPTAMRSASTSLKQCARGTRFPLGDKSTVRFFIYWVGRDIDLSATYHDENFNHVGHISYTNLRDSVACHSGDITHAPNGAAEFIDVKMDKLAKDRPEVRYIVMNVYVFSGVTFSEHSKVYAGWMTRDEPKKNAIWDPKTVENKLDLTQDSKNAVPIVIDVKERKVINVDLGFSPKFGRGGNNVESNRASIEETLMSIVNLNNKVTLANLFAYKGYEIVENAEDADLVVDWGGDVSPFDVNDLNSTYME